MLFIVLYIRKFIFLCPWIKFLLLVTKSFFFQTLYLEDGTMLPDPSSTSRPPRPNSIEVKRNYPPGSSGAYPNNEESAYGTRHSRSPQDGMYRLVIRFFWKIRTS